MAALADRMVFISGARQVGKTTLANRVGEQFFRGKYACFNWDSSEDGRRSWLRNFRPAWSMLFLTRCINSESGKI